MATARTRKGGSPSAKAKAEDENVSMQLRYVCLEYPYKQLEAATNGFDKSFQLGEGSAGTVFRAELPDGSYAAVKVIDLSALGDNALVAGFEDEIMILSKFRHPNLVVLMGWAREGSRRYLLYEFLSGGDVTGRLLKSKTGRQPFLWHERLSVARDAATGLAHLHNANPRAFHRDIKSSNILIGQGAAKMADFGLSCVARSQGKEMNCKFASGTPGYACPIYTQTGRVTEGSEVHSFGMVLLEMLLNLVPAGMVQGEIKYPIMETLRPQTPGALERACAGADPTAGWPAPVAREAAALGLACIDADESKRPRFNDICKRLRALQEQFPPTYAIGVQGPPPWILAAPRPMMAPGLPPGAQMPMVTAAPPGGHMPPRPCVVVRAPGGTAAATGPLPSPKPGAREGLTPPQPLVIGVVGTRPPGPLPGQQAGGPLPHPPSPHHLAGMARPPGAPLVVRPPGGVPVASGPLPPPPAALAAMAAGPPACAATGPCHLVAGRPPPPHHLVLRPPVPGIAGPVPVPMVGGSMVFPAPQAVVPVEVALEVAFVRLAPLANLRPEFRMLPLVPAIDGEGRRTARLGRIHQKQWFEAVLVGGDAAAVSREACELSWGGADAAQARLTLRALGVAGAILVDGQRAPPGGEPVPLRPGSQVSFASTQAGTDQLMVILTFVVHTAAPPREPPPPQQPRQQRLSSGGSVASEADPVSICTRPPAAPAPPFAGASSAASSSSSPAPAGAPSAEGRQTPRQAPYGSGGRAAWHLECIYAEGLSPDAFLALPADVRRLKMDIGEAVVFGRGSHADAFEALLARDVGLLQYVSRKHFQLERVEGEPGSGGGRLRVTNLSQNVAVVAQQPLRTGESAEVRDGDTLSFAHTVPEASPADGAAMDPTMSERTTYVPFLTMRLAAPPPPPAASLWMMVNPPSLPVLVEVLGAQRLAGEAGSAPGSPTGAAAALTATFDPSRTRPAPLRQDAVRPMAPLALVVDSAPPRTVRLCSIEVPVTVVADDPISPAGVALSFSPSASPPHGEAAPPSPTGVPATRGGSPPSGDAAPPGSRDEVSLMPQTQQLAGLPPRELMGSFDKTQATACWGTSAFVAFAGGAGGAAGSGRPSAASADGDRAAAKVAERSESRGGGRRKSTTPGSCALM